MPTSRVLNRTAAAAVLLSALGSALVRGQTPRPNPPAESAEAPATRNPGNTAWASSLAEARQTAKAEKKLVFHEFISPGCGQCRRMEALLYPAFDFEALLIGMVPVQVDIESPDGKALADRYGITETPSVLITNPSGRLAFLMQGFKDAPDFYQHAHADLNAYRKFARQIDAQDVATLPAAEAYATGRDLFTRYDYEGAAARLERAAAAAGSNVDLREKALMGVSAAERQLGHYAAARKAAETVVATTKNPDQKEQAELAIAEIALADNRLGEALDDYHRFAREHPNSPYIEKVRGFISKLEAAKAAASTPKS